MKINRGNGKELGNYSEEMGQIYGTTQKKETDLWISTEKIGQIYETLVVEMGRIDGTIKM